MKRYGNNGIIKRKFGGGRMGRERRSKAVSNIPATLRLSLSDPGRLVRLAWTSLKVLATSLGFIDALGSGKKPRTIVLPSLFRPAFSTVVAIGLNCSSLTLGAEQWMLWGTLRRVGLKGRRGTKAEEATRRRARAILMICCYRWASRRTTTGVR